MTKKTSEQSASPQDHPDPARWWRTIRHQSWVCLAALVIQGVALVWQGIPEAASAPLVVINLGLVAGFATYSGGCTLIDAIKAWRQ